MIFSLLLRGNVVVVSAARGPPRIDHRLTSREARGRRHGDGSLDERHPWIAARGVRNGKDPAQDAEELAMPSLAPFNPLLGHLFDASAPHQHPRRQPTAGTDAAALTVIALAIALVMLVWMACLLLVIVLIVSAT
jgi:hypothetical protein